MLMILKRALLTHFASASSRVSGWDQPMGPHAGARRAPPHCQILLMLSPGCLSRKVRFPCAYVFWGEGGSLDF